MYDPNAAGQLPEAGRRSVRFALRAMANGRDGESEYQPRMAVEPHGKCSVLATKVVETEGTCSVLPAPPSKAPAARSSRHSRLSAVKIRPRLAE